MVCRKIRPNCCRSRLFVSAPLRGSFFERINSNDFFGEHATFACYVRICLNFRGLFLIYLVTSYFRCEMDKSDKIISAHFFLPYSLIQRPEWKKKSQLTSWGLWTFLLISQINELKIWESDPKTHITKYCNSMLSTHQPRGTFFSLLREVSSKHANK